MRCLFVSLFLFSSFISRDVAATECEVIPTTLDYKVRNSDIIFSGTVLNVASVDNNTCLIEFRVDQALKKNNYVVEDIIKVTHYPREQDKHCHLWWLDDYKKSYVFFVATSAMGIETDPYIHFCEPENRILPIENIEEIKNKIRELKNE